MSSGVIEYQAIDKLHLRVVEDTALYHFLDAIEKQLDILSGSVSAVQDQFQIDNALGTSIDLIGLIFDNKREDGQTDLSYRSELISFIEDFDVQTTDTITDAVTDLCGDIPQVDQYPDVDFITEYGLSTNYGVFRVLVSFNKYAIWGDDIERLVNSLKAAGIAVIIEAYDRYFEDFFDTVYVTELLFLTVMKGVFDEALVNQGARIGYAQIGYDVIAGGIVTVFDGTWDHAIWDDSFWDGGRWIVQIEELF